jgi:hypothetical protein
MNAAGFPLWEADVQCCIATLKVAKVTFPPSRNDAIGLLDEVGNTEVCELFTVRNFSAYSLETRDG